MALYEAPGDSAEADDEGERPQDGGTSGESARGEAAGEAADDAETETGTGTDADGGGDGTGDAADGAPEAEGAEPGTAEDTEGDEGEDGDEPGSGRPADQATAVFRVPVDKADKTDGPGDTDTEDTGDGGDESDEPGPGRPVDQATAVFRVSVDRADAEDAEDAGKGSGAAKPVDQTTALLRVSPGRPRTEPEAEPKTEPEAEPEETPAERTSRFVPLRSADDARVPAPAASSEEPPRPELPEAERTKQQPLPPHKPLELLAELTNKPAPPETPLRVALRRIKIWSPLVLLLAIVLAVVQFLRPLPEPELRLTASATYAFEGEKPALAWPDEGQAVLEVEGLGSLGTYGEQEPVPIASVAKVMTAYVILRDHPVKPGEPGPEIPVDKQAEEDAGLSAQGESTVEVEEGEKLALEEALNALMIASANNVARLLARWDTGGSEEEFVEKMNEAAEELGMDDTTYTDPSGLRKETVSTAADQVKLGKKVMDYELFREIVRKPSYEDRNGVSHRNWNGLVPYDNAVGIKTGTTTAAGGNLLFAGEREIGGTTQLIVGAVFGQHKPPIIDTVINESRELLVSAQEVLKAEKIVTKGDVVGYVDDGLGGRTPLVATEDVTAVGWSGLKVELALTDGGKGVPHTAEAGRTVGTLTVGSGPGQVKVPVAVREELTEPDTGTRLTRIL